MVKQILGGLALILLTTISCNKKSENGPCPYTDKAVTVPATELADLEAYLDNKGITNAVKDSRGFYYTIQSAGTGATPGLCSYIGVLYGGKLTNDVIFDQTTGSPAAFTLGSLIPGWVKGIPLIKSGGRIILYLPPSMGYGSQAVGNVPANSILIFDIQLIGVQ